jgi:hypothetical protein
MGVSLGDKRLSLGYIGEVPAFPWLDSAGILMFILQWLSIHEKSAKLFLYGD